MYKLHERDEAHEYYLQRMIQIVTAHRTEARNRGRPKHHLPSADETGAAASACALVNQVHFCTSITKNTHDKQVLVSEF